MAGGGQKPSINGKRFVGAGARSLHDLGRSLQFQPDRKDEPSRLKSGSEPRETITCTGEQGVCVERILTPQRPDEDLRGGVAREAKTNVRGARAESGLGAFGEAHQDPPGGRLERAVARARVGCARALEPDALGVGEAPGEEG